MALSKLEKRNMIRDIHALLDTNAQSNWEPPTPDKLIQAKKLIDQLVADSYFGGE